jgi:hypothetical protein
MIAFRCRERVPDGLLDRIAAAIRQEKGGLDGLGGPFPV